MKDTQVKKVLRFMTEYGSITTMQAFSMGITRLASRIHEIRKMGIGIDVKTVCTKNRDGEPVHFAMYFLT